MAGATTVNILPRDDNTNGWSRILQARTPKPSLKGDVRADWVVLGAGWAGMAAARRLADNRPDDSIILVEAGEVGENASGRNSGFAIDLPHNVGSSLEELEGSHRFMALARAAIDHLEASVNAFGIDCNWSRQGKYHCSHTARGKGEILEPFARELDALGEPHRWLDARELQSEVGTPYYHAAIYTPGCVLMNPAALCRGLGDTMPENVTLHENTPVTRLERENGIRLTTPEGSVYAPRMMLTTNGFAEQFGFFSDKLIPIAAHASLTRPLTASERRALGGNDDWGITPANAIAGVTMRFTRDHRILIRHGFRYTPGFRISDQQLRDAVAHHKRCFADRFPMLPDVTFDHSWSGFVCMSRNSAPGFGKVAPNVWASVCQNAVGVTKGTIGGLLAADMACERENELIGFMESLGEPDLLPHKALLKIGVPGRIAWDVFTNRHEK